MDHIIDLDAKSLSLLRKCLSSVSDYLGVDLEDDIDKYASLIVNDTIRKALPVHGDSRLPEKVQVECLDGTVRELILTEQLVKLLMSRRYLCSDNHITKRKYRTLLLEYGPRICFCESNHMIYDVIEEGIGAYLMKHKAHSEIFDICDCKTSPGKTCGNTAKVYKYYIEHRGKIRGAVQVLGTNEWDWCINSPNFEWKYAVNRVNVIEFGVECANKIEDAINVAGYRLVPDLSTVACLNDISETDLIARVLYLIYINESVDPDWLVLNNLETIEGAYKKYVDEAVNLGIEDRIKYGIAYEISERHYVGRDSEDREIDGRTYNFIQYVRHAAYEEFKKQLEDGRVA